MPDSSRRQPVYHFPEFLVCVKCGERRSRDEFVKDSSKPSGVASTCRECDRERSRAYYAKHREKVLARAAARRPTTGPRSCSECGAPLEGRQRVTCGARRCRDARFKWTNPDGYAKREAAKVARRREARQRAREEGGSS